MAANKITYPTKVTNTPSPLPEAQKWTGPNATEVKDVVNSLADDVDSLQNGATGNSYSIGDGTAGNKEIVANNTDITKPRLRYNDTSNKWEFSNDGISFNELGSGSVVSIQAWAFDNATADAAPGSGNIRLNAADLTLATFIYISNENTQGLDVSEIINDLSIGSNIGIQQASNTSNAALYDISGEIINGGGYKKIPVTFKSKVGSLFDNTELLVLSITTVLVAETPLTEETVMFDSNLDTVRSIYYNGVLVFGVFYFDTILIDTLEFETSTDGTTWVSHGAISASGTPPAALNAWITLSGTSNWYLRLSVIYKFGQTLSTGTQFTFQR